MVDAGRIIDQIEDLGLQYMFATPAFMERVERRATAENITLPSLRRVLWAGRRSTHRSSRASNGSRPTRRLFACIRPRTQRRSRRLRAAKSLPPRSAPRRAEEYALAVRSQAWMCELPLSRPPRSRSGQTTSRLAVAR